MSLCKSRKGIPVRKTFNDIHLSRSCSKQRVYNLKCFLEIFCSMREHLEGFNELHDCTTELKLCFAYSEIFRRLYFDTLVKWKSPWIQLETNKAALPEKKTFELR